MAGLTLNTTSCVRSISKFSDCNLCEVICPVEAIKVAPESLPAINLHSCIGCGGCVGVCPTEALHLDNLSAMEFFFEFANEENSLISCQKNVPCLSVLNVEYLIALASLKEELVLDMGHCNTCSIKSTCKPQIEKNVEEANYVLDARIQSAKVTMKNFAYLDESVKPDSSRRDFFETFTLKNAFKAKKDFDRDVEIAIDEFKEHSVNTSEISKLRQKELIAKRKLHIMALKRVDKPEAYHVVDSSELTFTSQKLLNEASCTACQICYRICPTGALSSDMKNSKIDFDAFMCIKCHLCHDVCEPNAITVSPSYNVKEFFEPKIQRLITYDVKSCNECGMHFTSLKGEKICRRCALEEEEAKDLWGIE
ncbi:MAG: 4Fe-4S dicluster domain-containing protein [Campylobacterota bacterium]|nr:4Fe-4S dicluster domain-containing protein [Campylobacterota bacterium]